MAITFIETELDDGYLQINWDAATKKEFHRVLQAIKTMIPKQYRTWVPGLRVWTIAPEAIAIYEDIKQAVEQSNDNDGELLAPLVDSVIEDEAILNAMGDKLRSLPDSMREKALFAIEAAMDRIDTPVEFSLSKGLFGAWNEDHGHWFYEDGRYSKYSPSDWDDRAIASAHKRLERAGDDLAQFLDTMDETDEQQERRRFRLSMLEKYGHRCYICANRPDRLSRLHMHRVLPGREGGQYIESNVVILCTICHRHHEGLPWAGIELAREERRVILEDSPIEHYDPHVYECYDPDIGECYDPV